MAQTRFPKPGDLFAGRYRIESMLGKGGYARVFRATELELGRAVAVKILARGLANPDDTTLNRERGESANRRFRREAQLASKLRDPHTVMVLDYGETDMGLLYIVFELIEGRTLAEVIEQEGPLAPGRVVTIMRKVLSSLREAHGKGILHRDIKPTNIMAFTHLGKEEVKLVDFGVAKMAGDEGRDLSELTKEGSLIGTPRYMAPELIRANELGPPVDIFSLGMVAFEMLTGQQANSMDSPVAVLGRQLDDEPFMLPLHLDVPAGLQHTVHFMLKKDPIARFQSAGEVISALENWNTDDSDTAKTVLSVRPNLPSRTKLNQRENTAKIASQPGLVGPGDETPDVERREPDEQTPGQLLALLLMLAALGVGLGLALYHASDPGSNQPGFVEETAEPDVAPGESAPEEVDDPESVAAQVDDDEANSGE